MTRYRILRVTANGNHPVLMGHVHALTPDDALRCAYLTWTCNPVGVYGMYEFIAQVEIEPIVRQIPLGPGTVC